MCAFRLRIVAWLLVGALCMLVFVTGAVVLLGIAAASANIVISSAPDQSRAAGFAEDWQAPVSGAEAGTLFPSRVQQWQLASRDDAAVIAELAIERDGRHGRYESIAGIVDVYVYEVPAAEQPGLFDRAEIAIDSAGYRTMASHRAGDALSSWMQFAVSPPNTHGRLWWCRGWLFVFIAHESSIDLDAFEEAYLRAVSASGTIESDLVLREEVGGES